MNPKLHWDKIDKNTYKVTWSFIELVRIEFVSAEKGWKVSLLNTKAHYIKEPFANLKKAQILAEKGLKRYIEEVNKIIKEI